MDMRFRYWLILWVSLGMGGIFWVSSWPARGAGAFGLPLVFGGFVVLFDVMLRQAQKDEARQAQEEAARKRAATERKSAAAAQTARMTRALESTRSLSNRALEATQRANQQPHVCKQWIESMKVHRSNGAIPPFWESAEGGLNAIATYLACIQDLVNLSQGHQEACSTYISEGGDRDDLAPFPVTVASVYVTSALTRKRQLDELIYQALTDYKFATIYEQRRTTAAVIVGFRDLSSAIAGLPAALEDSHADLRIIG